MLLYSQRPKCWVFPQTNQGGEMELPFFYHKNWLSLSSAQDAKDMGVITPVLFAALTSCNGVTGTSVVVNVYAWAEEVKLHGPTMSAVMQSDEFDYKPSQIASSVAAATGSLSRVPIIGPYMKATSSVSKAFASIASSFGFTNVPNISPVQAVRQTPFPHNASCEISNYVERAAVDPKNEVTIDPRTVGLDGTDEMAISYIAQRETYLGSAILSSTDSVDALTMVSRVTPCLGSSYGGVTNPIQFTPMGYLTQMFKCWRGDVIFRFKFICTRFHKGRVRISWDPVANISTTIPDYTSVFNEVIDIGAEQDIEVRVPYSQATTYLLNSSVIGNYNFAGTALGPTNTANGLITMRVVNPLTGPVANTAIPVMVFVRGADNLEFAWPSTRFQSGTSQLSPYTLQSQEVEYPLQPKRVIAGNTCHDGDPNRHHVHFGEAIKTLRTLIHRPAYSHTVQSSELGTTNNLNAIHFYHSRRLKYYGYDPNGYTTALNQAGTATVRFNFVRANFQQLISMLYIGQRGSMTWQYNIESTMGTAPATVAVRRYDDTIVAGSSMVVDTTLASSVGETGNGMMRFFKESQSGTALTDARSQPALSMNFPYYSPYNFQFVDPTHASVGNPVDGTDQDNLILDVVTQKQTVPTRYRAHFWSTCGPDYNFFFFINTPSLYSFGPPTGV
nr:MAG: capsid protein [Crogonang virus 13]